MHVRRQHDTLAAAEIHGSFHVENSSGWFPSAQYRYSAVVEKWLSPMSDDVEIIERMAKELLNQRPLLAGKKWHELKEITRISLRRDAERLLRISRGEEIHA